MLGNHYYRFPTGVGADVYDMIAQIRRYAQGDSKSSYCISQLETEVSVVVHRHLQKPSSSA